MGLAATKNGNKRGCGDFMRLNGVSSNFAHEQSTTANPDSTIICLSAGLTQFTPTGDRTKPGNRCPNRKLSIKPCRAS